MKIGLYQFEVAFKAPEENLRRIAVGTRGLDVELLVLPELCTSGYLLTREEAHRLAIELPSEGLAPLVDVASQLDTRLVAGVIERQGDRLYNSIVLVDPGGWVATQRKIHLTTLERRVFSSGTELQTFSFGPLRVGVVTCFDAWFPEASRQLTRSGAQLLCQPAAFGGRRTLDVMRVRSMENHVFSATANRLGRERSDGVDAQFRGESQIVDCDGSVIAAAADQPEALTCEVDVERADAKANAMCSDLAAEWGRYYSEFGSKEPAVRVAPRTLRS